MLFQGVESRLGEAEVVGGEGAVDHAIGAAGQRDQPLLVKREVLDRDQRLAAVGAVAIGFGRELDEVGVAGRILGEEGDPAVIDVPQSLARWHGALGLDAASA